MDMIAAMDFRDGVHLNFNHIHIDGHTSTSELCMHGTNPIIDTLFDAGMLPVIAGGVFPVVWGTLLHLSSGTTLTCDSWALLTHESTTFLAKITAFFSISGVIFVHTQPYPFTVLAHDPNFSSYVASHSDLQNPSVCCMSFSIESITQLSKLRQFNVNSNTHFVKG